MKLKEFLKDKKVIFYGDSLTHNWEKYTHAMKLTQGEDYDYSLGPTQVAKLDRECHFKKVTNCAVSGGCFANCEGLSRHPRERWRHFPFQVKHSLYEIQDADVIFILLGSNDYSEQNPFGKNTDVAYDEHQNSTFYGGMNYGLNWILKVNPKVKIFMLTCLPRTCPIDLETFNYSLDEYNLAIKETANRYNIQLIDTSRLFPISKVNEYTNDGLHLNDAGYELLTKFIINQELEER